MHAVHFGAGNIGRGFLGQLYWESGWNTTFVDVAADVIGGLKERNCYPLDIVDEDNAQHLTIDRVDALDARDTQSVANAVAGADLLSTAVGAAILPHIAPALALGLKRRWEGAETPRPLDIIICENLLHAGPYLRGQIQAHLPDHLHPLLETHAGFVEASVGRMVPVRNEAQRAEDPLRISVEPYCELPVDADAFRGPIPAIAHLKPISNFGAYVERKLYVHNMSHAVTAYAGHARGHEFIWQAIRDAEVRELVEGALSESCNGLARKHGLDLAQLQEHAADLVHRYHNRALGDQIMRVARDPLRKLDANDRLIGAGRMCLAQGITPVHIAQAAALALRYEDPSDPAAVRLQQLLKEKGVLPTLQEVAGIEKHDPLARLIESVYTSR